MHKGPSWKLPFILALVLVSLGGLALWSETILKPKKELQAEAQKKPMRFTDSEKIETLRIFNGSSTVLISCLEEKGCKEGDSSKWELNIPAHFKADGQSIGGLITALHNLTVENTIDLSQDDDATRARLLKDYKLDADAQKPVGTRQIEVKIKGGNTRTLFVGEQHPTGEGFFGLRSGDDKKVYVLPAYFKTHFEQPLTHWRDKGIFSVSNKDITEFELDSKTKLKGIKKDNQWVLDFGDGPVAGDVESVDSLLAALTSLTAKDFVSETKGDDRTQKALQGATRVARYKLKTDKKEQPEIVFEIFSREKPNKAGFAQVSNLDNFFEVDAGAADRLVKKKEDLRMSKLIPSIERFTIKNLEFDRKTYKGHILISQKDGKWIRESDKKAIPDRKIQAILDNLSGNRVKEYIAGKKAPAGIEDGLTLTLSEDLKSPKRKYTLWKMGENTYAKDLLSSRDEVFKIDASTQAVLPWTPDFFDLPEAPAGNAKGAVPQMIGQPGAAPHSHEEHE